jgi:hypothetical protein
MELDNPISQAYRNKFLDVIHVNKLNEYEEVDPMFCPGSIRVSNSWMLHGVCQYFLAQSLISLPCLVPKAGFYVLKRWCYS